MASVGDPIVALGSLRSGHGVAFLPPVFGDPHVDAEGLSVRSLSLKARPSKYLHPSLPVAPALPLFGFAVIC